MGCIDMVGPMQSVIPSTTLTSVEGVGDSDPTQADPGFNSYKPPSAPTDMTQGDWAQVGTLGNHVAVLEGGVSSIGSPTALLQSLGATGTLRSVARQLQQFTDFGKLTIENNQGMTSLILRAGSNQTTQTGLDEQHYTIRLDLGATGDVLDFAISEPEGRLLFRLHAGSDGRVQIYGDGGVDLSSGTGGTGTFNQNILGDHTTTITGDVTHSAQGDETIEIDGDKSVAVGGDTMHSTAGNVTHFVGGDHDVGVSGDETHAVAGKRVVQIGGDDNTSVDGNSTTAALQVLTVDGVQVKLGANAVEPAIKGTSYQASVMSQIGAAGSALTSAGAAAAGIVAPDVATMHPSVATSTAVAAIATTMAAVGSLLSAAAAAYTSTLSQKVVVE
jgi:hypothetical protein